MAKHFVFTIRLSYSDDWTWCGRPAWHPPWVARYAEHEGMGANAGEAVENLIEAIRADERPHREAVATFERLITDNGKPE